ncbi:LOW QUALITY PROTEIN: hypothetical protein ACHAW6_009108 [Cyclotella cf. meneghiniana]
MQSRKDTSRHSQEKFGQECNSNIQKPFHCNFGWHIRRFSNPSMARASTTNSSDPKPPTTNVAPTVSAYAYHHGRFDYKRMPLAPMAVPCSFT